MKDSRAEGIDAILVDQENFELIFIQAKLVNDYDSTKKNFPENDIKLTLQRIRFLLRGDYKGNMTPALENLVDEYHELDRTGDYKTSVIFLTLKRKPIDNKYIEDFKKDFSQVEIKFFDFGKFYDFYVNDYLKMRAISPKIISFEVVSGLLKKDNPQKSRVFTCKGKELARIYNEHKERIFQQNVRYSLGLRSKSINRQILETAKDNTRSMNFWYFNNGITIICKKIIESTSEKLVMLEDPQIINGAQTTYALHEAFINGNLKENVEVLIKAIQADDRNFIENVTLYTNSQNAIRLRDLCSNDEIQLKNTENNT
ncbi:MAG: AIPR family protein [Bacteroidetes bacterium]|nr:AIPR family protein [Bacteroidota bacterium]